MSALKSLALGVVFGLGTHAVAWADPVSSGSASWVYFVGGPGQGPSSNLRSQFPSLFAPRALVPPAAPAPANTPPAPASIPAFSAPASAPPVVPAAPLMAAPASVPTPAPAAPASADAYLNLGTSAAPEESQLTTGGGKPWYTSPAVLKAFGGSQPDATQQADFANKVLADVKHTFSLAGLNETFTLNPNVPAGHTMSVLSGTGYGPNPNAIGITDVGHNGFNFIDKFAYANTPDELAQALAKNMSHELMHALGVANHPDATGQYIDTGTATWALLTNSDSTFSPAAVSAINAAVANATAGGTLGTQQIDGAEELAAVPEPTTWALWAAGGLGAFFYRRRKAARPLAA